MILCFGATEGDSMSVAIWSGSLLAWERELTVLRARLAPVFRRRELQETGAAFLDGLLSGVERKTGWLMAEHAGFERPYRMQSLRKPPVSAADFGGDGMCRGVVHCLYGYG
jgi:hypothetical protein